MDNQSQLDSLFHALADPTRRAVVQRLVRGEATASELAGPFAMALPSFMKHLRVLEAAGLIATEKKGRARVCSLSPAGLARAEAWFEAQRALRAGRGAALDALLGEMQAEAPARRRFGMVDPGALDQAEAAFARLGAAGRVAGTHAKPARKDGEREEKHDES